MEAIKILLIDADSASRNFLSTALRQQGYEVLCAASAKHGLLSAWTDRPAVIVADPILPDLAGEELAERLRAHPSTAGISLIALSSDQQPARQQSCEQAGFSAYILKSPRAMSALTDILRDVQHKQAAPPREGGLLIVFLSAKGGTGTSSLCANLAMNIAAQRPQARVAVVDLVLPIGSIAGIVGYEGSQNVVSLGKLPASATTVEFLRENLPVIQGWGFHLLAGSPDPELGNEIDVSRIEDIVLGLQQAYDYVVIDLGRSLSRISLPLIQRADLLAMIVAADRSTVTLTCTVWEYLQHKGVRPSAVYLILNRAVGLEGLTKAEAEAVIGLPIHAAVPHLAENISLANNQHHPYVANFPSDAAAIVLRESARQMQELAAALRHA